MVLFGEWKEVKTQSRTWFENKMIRKRWLPIKSDLGEADSSEATTKKLIIFSGFCPVCTINVEKAKKWQNGEDYPSSCTPWIIIYCIQSCFSLWQCNANHFFVQSVSLMIWEICVHKYLPILSLISLCSFFIWFIMIFNSIHPVTHEGWWHRVVCVT